MHAFVRVLLGVAALAAGCAILPSPSSSSLWPTQETSLVPAAVGALLDEKRARQDDEEVPLELPPYPSAHDLRAWWRDYGDTRMSSFREITIGSERAVYAEVALDDGRIAFVVDHERDSDPTVIRWYAVDPEARAERIVAWLCRTPVVARASGWAIPAMGIELSRPSAIDMQLLSLTPERNDACDAERVVWPRSSGADALTQIAPARVMIKTATRSFDVAHAYALERARCTSRSCAHRSLGACCARGCRATRIRTSRWPRRAC